MKKVFLFTCLLAGIGTSFAQTDVAAKYAAIVNVDNLHKHLSIIAGAEMEAGTMVLDDAMISCNG